MMRRSLWLLCAVAACYPTTTRPDFTPLPAATTVEVELDVPAATRRVAMELDADSIPVSRTEPKDGWLETEWFDATTLTPVSGRPLGPNVVKVRAFVDPGRPNFSNVQIEVVMRTVANPAVPGRDLEQMVEGGHPVMLRVLRVVGRLRGDSAGNGVG